MTAQEAALSWLEDPQVYAVNRIEAHSDHFFYEEMPDTGREEKMLPSETTSRAPKYQMAAPSPR